MTGNSRKRFCSECQLNVYNLSGMTKTEAENLLLSSEGRLCVRFYQRSDGTVLTQDCPVGWAAFKRRVSKTAAAAASLIFGIISGLGFNAFFSQKEKEQHHVMGAVAYQPTPKATPQTTPSPDEPVMGKIAPVKPDSKVTSKKKDLKATIKKVVNASENQS